MLTTIKSLFFIPFSLMFLSCSPSNTANKNFVKTIDQSQIKELVNKRHITVLYFWTTWCAPCRSTLAEEIVKLRLVQNKDSVSIIPVCITKDLSKAEELYKKAGLTEDCYVYNDLLLDNAIFQKNAIGEIARTIFKVDKDFDYVPVVIVVNHRMSVLSESFSMADVGRIFYKME